MKQYELHTRRRETIPATKALRLDDGDPFSAIYSTNALKDQLSETFLKMLIVLGCSLAGAFQMILAFPALNFGDVPAFEQSADVVLGVDLAALMYPFATRSAMRVTGQASASI